MYLPKEKYIKNKKGIARNYMAPVNVLILELNVRERLYSAMPFKILQIYMKTANRYAYASCFSGNIFPKRKRISGPQYISCQKKATGKFMKVV